jgi:hypothetical protein
MLWQLNKWEFYYCAYFEEGGFADKSVLTKARTEFDDQFTERRNYSVYPNYVRSIIDSTYTPVFTKPVKRTTLVNGKEDKEGTGVPVWAAFCKDVDHRHSDMATVVEKFVKHARILGVSYLVCDAPRELAELKTVVDLVDERKYPWISMRLPQQVVQELLVVDDFCNLQEIVFIEANDKATDKPRAKKWTKDYCCMMEKDKEDKWVEMKTTIVEYYLDDIPVMPILSTESQDATIIPKSTFASVIDCNLAIFNIWSEVRRMGRSQMFPILCLPNMQGSFVASVNNGISLPANDANQSWPLPMYLCPDVGPYDSIVNTIKFLSDELFRVSGQEGVVGVQKKKQSPSGIEASYEFMSQNWVLLKSADMAKKTEEGIARLFKLYIPEEFEYTAEYCRSYQPTETQAKSDRDNMFLDKISTLSTPYNPVVAMVLSDWILANYNAEDQKVIDTLKWIADSTSKDTEKDKPPAVNEEAAVNDKIMSFLQDKNKLPNDAVKKVNPFQKKVSAIA